MKAWPGILFIAVMCTTVATAAVDITESSVLPGSPERDIPQTIWFQGFVEDTSTGEPVTATHNIEVEIFDADTGDASLWGPESHLATDIVDGWFNIELGISVDLPLFDSSSYYLQLTIDGEVLAPRQKLGSVPASFRSARTDDIDDDWLYSGGHIYRMSGNIGVNTMTPERDLDVAGTVRMDAFEMVPGATSGHVLTSDAAGVGTWQAAPGGGGLTLPYSGSADHEGPAFRVDNTSPLAASIAISGHHGVAASAGHLGGRYAGVYGEGATDGTVYAGRFDGDVLVNSGRFGVGMDPSDARIGVTAGSDYESALYARQATTTGVRYGVYAIIESPAGSAVYGEASADSAGVGVHGVAEAAWSTGVLGEGPYYAVRGINTNSGAEGRMGAGSTGVYGQSAAPGFAGWFNGEVYVTNRLGVRTLDPDASVHAVSVGGMAIHGMAETLDSSPHYGVFGETDSDDGYGIYGESPFIGVGGYNTDTGAYGRLGYSSIGVFGMGGSGGGAAGVFEGRVDIDGDLGIQTSYPASALDVDGLACIRGGIWPAEDTGASLELAYNSGVHRGYIQVYDRDIGGAAWGQLYLGASSVGIGTAPDYSHELVVGGDIQCVDLHQTSEPKFRTDVRELTGALDAISRLSGVSFMWNEESATVGATPGERGIGVVAEELEREFPELVSASERSHRAVDYSKLTAVLIEAVKELREENDSLRARVEALEAGR